MFFSRTHAFWIEHVYKSRMVRDTFREIKLLLFNGPRTGRETQNLMIMNSSEQQPQTTILYDYNTENNLTVNLWATNFKIKSFI